MEDHLAKRGHGWFVGDHVTLADVYLFAYTHVAHQAGFDLANWPAIQRWCEQVMGFLGYIPMDD